MPLVKVEQINEDTKILIWYISENADFFESHLSDLFDEPLPWANMKEKRKREFVSSRYLIQLGLPPGAQVKDLVKDTYGCPKLITPPCYVAISHSGDYTGCVISKSRGGCDIERFQTRILSMAHRFMSSDELAWTETEHQLAKTHLIWGIKESAFKTWGRKQIDWKKNINLDLAEWNHAGGSFTGTIGNHAGSVEFHGGYEYFDQILFVWSLES